MTILAISLISVLALTGCSSDDQFSPELEAEAVAGAACRFFAEVYVDAASGRDELTRNEGVNKIESGMEMAQLAAARDSRWEELALDFAQMAEGMKAGSDVDIAAGARGLGRQCDPLLDEFDE